MSATTRSSGTQKPDSSASGTASSIRDTAAEIGAEAKQEARRQAGHVQKTASESMSAFAHAIRSASDELASKDQGPAAQILAQAAGGLEQLSSAVSQNRLEDIVSDVRRFGREHPAAFLMGSVLVGIALGRFAQTTVAGATQTDRSAAERDAPKPHAGG